MSKSAVVYWSGTGSTEVMAAAVAEGVRSKGAEAALLTAAGFSSGQLGEYSAAAFGCPAMGAEQLEERKFKPVFTVCEAGLNNKKTARFGSYGWGSGEWMQSWEAEDGPSWPGAA